MFNDIIVTTNCISKIRNTQTDAFRNLGFVLLFNCFVVPKLEYAVQVWYPYHQVNINKFEIFIEK